MSNDEEPEAAENKEIKVFTTTKTLSIEKFKIPENRLEIGRAWEEWLEDFEEEISYLEIDKIKDKVSALKIYGGQEIKKLARNLPEPTAEENDDDYKKLKRKLNNHFLPRKNKHHARYTFSKERMHSNETVVNYAARMREKAKDCEFGDQLDDRILEHLIQTVQNEDLIKECIRKKWNLDRFIDEASQREDISQQVQDMKTEHKVAKLQRDRKSPQGDKQQTRKRHAKPEDHKKTEKPCYYCGNTGTHKPGKDCPAYGKQCLKCGKFNHFAKCCNRAAQKEKPESNRDQQRVKKTTESSSDSSSDEEFLRQATSHIDRRAKNVRSGGKTNTVRIRMADLDADVEPDSGASANIMDEYQFRALKHRSQEIQELYPSEERVRALQSKLEVKGEFPVTLRNKTRGTKTKFLVIKGKMDDHS